MTRESSVPAQVLAITKPLETFPRPGSKVELNASHLVARVNGAVEQCGREPVAPAVSANADRSLVVLVPQLRTSQLGKAAVSDASAIWLRELRGEVVCRPQPDGEGGTAFVRLLLLPAGPTVLPVTSVSVSAEEA
ncbi:hypothetical protein ABZX85_39370 [Streptomyces sp. NPDC004539]|uniref:hypothetical protein n=1 Tax=Streptomyces sp. NPDC004539 TaxID=3154280 RepID=UPI0033A7D78A